MKKGTLKKKRKMLKLKRYALSFLLGTCIVAQASIKNNNSNISYALDVSKSTENPSWGGGSLTIDKKGKELAQYYKEYIEFNKNYNIKDEIDEVQNLTAGISREQLLDLVYEREPDYGFPCSLDLQKHIRNIADKYEVPFEVIMILLDQESNGHWKDNGKISPTNDYGLAQIHYTVLPLVQKGTGLTKEQILNDPYAAAEACAYIVKYTWGFLGYDLNNFHYLNTFGSYCAWIDWQKSPEARIYADSCIKRLKEHFWLTDEQVNDPKLYRSYTK